MSYGNVFELNLVTRVDMLRGEIFCESGGVNGRDEKLDWNYVSAGGNRSLTNVFYGIEKYAQMLEALD